MLVKSTFASKQPSVEPEHECCVRNNIRCQLEAFLSMWREIIYKVYGKHTIKENEPLLYLNLEKAHFLSHSQRFIFRTDVKSDINDSLLTTWLRLYVNIICYRCRALK